MSNIIKTSDFDPLVPWIREMNPTTRYVKIELPSTFKIDEAQAMTFLDDVTIEFERRGGLVNGWVTGVVRDADLYTYLTDRRKGSGYAFEMCLSPEFENLIASFK